MRHASARRSSQHRASAKRRFTGCASAAVDPFTVGVIRDSLAAAAEESFVRFGRSSQSPIIYGVLDYVCGITDGRGNLVAQANGVPGFLGTLSFAVKAIIERYGLDGMEPGDLFITNDPYTGEGNHLSDVALAGPVFPACGKENRRRVPPGGSKRAGREGGRGPRRARGRDPIAFAVNKAHWTEVGWMAAGSWTTDSTEIYQEGLQFPLLRLGRRWETDPALVDLIGARADARAHPGRPLRGAFRASCVRAQNRRDR